MNFYCWLVCILHFGVRAPRFSRAREPDRATAVPSVSSSLRPKATAGGGDDGGRFPSPSGGSSKVLSDFHSVCLLPFLDLSWILMGSLCCITVVKQQQRLFVGFRPGGPADLRRLPHHHHPSPITITSRRPVAGGQKFAAFCADRAQLLHTKSRSNTSTNLPDLQEHHTHKQRTVHQFHNNFFLSIHEISKKFALVPRVRGKFSDFFCAILGHTSKFSWAFFFLSKLHSAL
ncbi:hypothetical protein BZA77DRAFT_94286 [Pyronema omphalodes]|nr:hypothetical protein BZA77DRAFT_94286 [Pyronema omphalodes]